MSNTTRSLLILIGSFVFLLGCEPPASDKEVVEANPHERSKAIYQEACASCHGVEIAAFADRKWQYGSDKDSIVEVITYGIADKDMPGYDSAYSTGAIDSLADYILTIKEMVDAYQFEGESNTTGVYSSEKYNLRLDTVVSGISIPWGLDFLPSGELLVTDRSGQLYRVGKNGDKTEIKGVPEVLAQGQGGLFDILLHPNFEENHLIYLSYSISKKEGDEVLASTAVNRAVLDGDRLKNSEMIFEAKPYFDTRHHYAGQMDFGPDGKLYISVGDRGKTNENPQALDRALGKVHRINDDGTIPDDNPFVNQPEAVASIYSYGHRNPQGMDIHPKTGAVWTHEHGPRGGDEINIVNKGLNYGWPVICYGINYNGTVLTDKVSKEGMEQPLHYWVPSIGPSGMAFVTGDRYPDWEGNLLIGSLKYRFLDRVVLDGDKVVKEESLLKKIGRVRSVVMGPDGYVYVGVEGSPGFVARLMPVI